MTNLIRNAWPLLLLVAAVAPAGCGPSQGQATGAKPPPPEVSVSAAVTEEVTDYEDFPGRLEAVNSIEIRARVTGFLTRVNFKEGSIVNKGDLLFEIDARPYKAELDRTQGIVQQMDGRLKRLEADFARAKMLLPKNAISQEEHDKIVGDRTEAEGNLKVARANQETAGLKLAWTKVESPLTGRISRRFMDPGNLVKEDETILTTIVDLDPIYAYFDVDERTTLRLQKLVRDGKITWSMDVGLPVYLGLADEKAYPRQGRIKFADNRVDSDTGTWRLRALFPNPDQALTPGLFVRLRAPIGNPFKAILVSEQALGTDQGQKFVYVVKKVAKTNEQGLSEEIDQVDYRRVKVGRVHHGLRAITEGLALGEKVIVSGLQRARPGIEVTPVVVPMPVVADPSNEKK